MDGSTLRQLGLDHRHGGNLDNLYQQRTAGAMKPTETEEKRSGENVLHRVCDVSKMLSDLASGLSPVLDRKRWSYDWKLRGRSWRSSHCCHRNKHFALEDWRLCLN